MTIRNRRQLLQLGLGALALPLVAKAAHAAGHATHVIEIKGHKFSPATLKMKAGDKVQFVNLDGAPHTGTDRGGAFGTKRLNKGDDGTVEIKDAGEYSYFCKFHPAMKGKIIAT